MEVVPSVVDTISLSSYDPWLPAPVCLHLVYIGDPSLSLVTSLSAVWRLLSLCLDNGLPSLVCRWMVVSGRDRQRKILPLEFCTWRVFNQVNTTPECGCTNQFLHDHMKLLPSFTAFLPSYTLIYFASLVTHVASPVLTSLSSLCLVIPDPWPRHADGYGSLVVVWWERDKFFCISHKGIFIWSGFMIIKYLTV